MLNTAENLCLQQHGKELQLRSVYGKEVEEIFKIYAFRAKYTYCVNCKCKQCKTGGRRGTLAFCIKKTLRSIQKW